MSNVLPEILESFGVEIEFMFPTQKRLTNDPSIRELGLNITYDASTETQTDVCSETGLSIMGSPYQYARGNTVKIGGEIVSGIWNMRMGDKEILKRLSIISDTLARYGEQPQNTRSSIHFHICFPKNLDTVKKVIHLGAHLEKLFFTIGGMGYAHRGTTSDAVYYRPITRSGPLCVPVPGGWAQVFDIAELGKSESLNEFFTRYGDSNFLGRGRYPIVRYHWLNLVNLVTSRTTLEVRSFNFSLDPLKILAALKLVRAFAEFSLFSSWGDMVANGFLKQNSVFDVIPLEQTLNVADRFFTVSGVQKKYANILLGLIESTPQPVIKERLVRSHLHDRHNVPIHWVHEQYKPEKIPTSKIELKPDYEDFYTNSNSNNIRVFRTWAELRRESVYDPNR